MTSTDERLEYLRGELRAERISYSELAELQGLAEHIGPSDVELLEAAGVPEHADTLTCPECGEEVWDGPHGSKLAKCWNTDGHESGGTLAFDTMPA